jgi:hypothetical protein
MKFHARPILGSPPLVAGPCGGQNRSVSLESGIPPDAGQKTVKGCECKTSCGASIDDQFKCDWCYTNNNCGRSGATGSWDYCVYPGIKEFESKSFTEKSDYFWSKITADKKRGEYANPLAAVTEDVQTSFYDLQDEMPAGRVKSIHGVGAICKFDMKVAKNSPYTGLFSAGTQSGFIRMGGATAWTTSDKGYPPGLGIKFPRSGIPSGNFVALVSLDAATFNFMQFNFSNHIAPPASTATKVLVKKFQQASQCPSQVGLSDMAKYSQNGEKAANPKTPFKLFLVPSEAVQRPNTPKSIDEVMADLESFPVGTPLLSVYACGRAMPSAEISPTEGGVEGACGEPFLLGDMVTTSECTTSAYGDAKFFIHHQPIEEDWQQNPEILNQYNADEACYWTGPKMTPSGIPKQCGA